MYNIDYFNTTLCDSVENDVVWMCNDFTHARYAWAALEEVRVFCRMFKVVLYSLNQTFCGLVVVFADGSQNLK